MGGAPGLFARPRLTAWSDICLAYSVLAASNGREALLLLERHDGPVDLTLTDVVMPKMTGPELAAQLAAIRPQMKILFTSGYAYDATPSHREFAEAAQYIDKPYTMAGLARKIREVLDS